MIIIIHRVPFETLNNFLPNSYVGLEWLEILSALKNSQFENYIIYSSIKEEGIDDRIVISRIFVSSRVIANASSR